ncbi:MAG: NRAMP family divalent metal transporter [Cyclobacteriaceae bacterium]
MMKTKAPSTLGSVIIWSVISAAFIGPGTITTALSAGANHQLELLWTVVFATVACIVLQEVSARLVIDTGLTLGEAIQQRLGASATMIKWLTGGSVVLGCAAYEAGNILGAISGLQLLFPVSRPVLTIAVVLVAGAILWSSLRKLMGWVMTALVALMGVAFLFLSFRTQHTLADVGVAMSHVQVPPGAELLALGLVGTTIVPYNIFLGSGIGKGQTLALMRTGLSVSVIIGGAITAWILLAGTLLPGFDSFQLVAEVFRERVGVWGAILFGLGLFAAGFSSAITSPFAAQVVAETVFGWRSQYAIKALGLLVLATGFAFGLSGRAPIPVIVIVQALNGLILPLLTGLLIYLVNDRHLVSASSLPSWWYNVVLVIVMMAVTRIGVAGISKSWQAVMGVAPGESINWLATGLITAAATLLAIRGRFVSR